MARRLNVVRPRVVETLDPPASPPSPPPAAGENGTWSNSAAAATPAVSVIVPTRNEAPNVAPLLGRLSSVAAEQTIEVIFVDDSDDDTPARVQVEAGPLPFGVTCLHRKRDSRAGGLGGAVVAGLRAARGEWACVMDGDLQHPPEVLGPMVVAGGAARADVVVGTRYANGGSVGDFGATRELVSRLSSLAARTLFPRKLRGVSDPMSGLFAVRPAALDLETFRPQGFKILMEILVRSEELRVTEVAYSFGARHAGESHASIREGGRFLRLLCDLRLSSGRQARFAGFAVVGLTGFAVNLGVTAALTEWTGTPYLLSAFLATQASTTWNFALTEAFVFGDRRSRGLVRRFLSFALLNEGAFALRGPMIYALTAGLGLHYLASTFASLVGLTVARFAVSDRWIWTKERS
jgi:dolichol-phosphate mannosyltransferase